MTTIDLASTAADLVGTRNLSGFDAFTIRLAFRAAAGRGTSCEQAYAVELLGTAPELDLTAARALLMPNRGNAYAQARDEASLFGMALAAEARTAIPGAATAVLFDCLAEDLFYERSLTAAPADLDEDDVVATVEFARLTGIALF